MSLPDPTRIALATRHRLYSLSFPSPAPLISPLSLFSLTLLPVRTFVLCFIIWPLRPLLLHVSPSLSFSILFALVHFSLECLSSQAPLCSGLPLLNTNKTRTTRVEQGARARRDKRLRHRGCKLSPPHPLTAPGDGAQAALGAPWCGTVGWGEPGGLWLPAINGTKTVPAALVGGCGI